MRTKLRASAGAYANAKPDTSADPDAHTSADPDAHTNAYSDTDTSADTWDQYGLD